MAVKQHLHATIDSYLFNFWSLLTKIAQQSDFSNKIVHILAQKRIVMRFFRIAMVVLQQCVTVVRREMEVYKQWTAVDPPFVYLIKIGLWIKCSGKSSRVRV